MWIINNLLDVLRTLDEKHLSLTKVSTWDFSTLYTSLPHAKLKLQLHDLLERVFTTKGKSFIATNSYHTFWTNDRKSRKYTYFTCRQLCFAVDFLIDNIYVRFGNSVFRQVIGIPMGTNSAPLLADLFLHTFEYDFMLKTMKADMSKAVKFSTPFVTSTIYSASITTTLETLSVKFIRRSWNSRILPSVQQRCVIWTQKSFMETAARLFTSACTTKEKTSTSGLLISLSWTATSLFFPCHSGYGVYISQLVRYARIRTAKADFMHRLRRLSSRLKQQGFKSTLLVKSDTDVRARFS